MTTPEVGDLVERLATRDRRLWGKDGQAFCVRDVAYFQSETTASSAWVEGRGEPVAITENLNTLERTLKGLFVRCHRSYLVAADRVTAIFERYPETPEPPMPGRLRNAADECELVIDGAPGRVPVSSLYAKGLKKALGLSSLHHLVPEHPDDKVLRLYGLIDFDWRDLFKLDPKNQAAVTAFKAAWDIKEFSKERMLSYFRQFGVNEIDKRRLLKNIIYQMWRWIKKGIEAPSDGNIRSLWYRIKGALSHHSDILDPTDVGMFYDALREMIEDRRMFRYKDFGFMDMNEPYRAIGTKRPEVVLAVEKTGQFQFARSLAMQAGASFICLKGEPAVISIEYFSDDLRAAIGGKPLSLFCMTDLDPAGYSIQRSFVDGLTGHGLAVAKVVKLVDPSIFPDDVASFSKYPVVRFETKGNQVKPIAPATMSQVTKARDWLANDVKDPRLYSEQDADTGRKVCTIWGIESDAADRDEIKKRFLDGVAQTKKARRQ